MTRGLGQVDVGRLLDKQESGRIRDKVNICEPNKRTDE